MKKQIYCCPKCGNLKASKENMTPSCDLCGTEMINTGVDEDWWHGMNETDKQYVIDKYTNNSHTSRIDSPEISSTHSSHTRYFRSECKKYLSTLGMICIVLGTILGLYAAIQYINIEKDDILMAVFIFIGSFVTSAISALFLYVLTEILEALEIISANTATSDKR